MSKLDQIFEEYIVGEKLGRIYTGENEHIRRIYNDFNDAVLFQIQSNSKLPKPSLFVTSLSSDFSAFVFKEQGHYFIGISIGAIESLFRFFQFLYSQPYYDIKTGDCTKEVETKLDTSLNPDYLMEYFNNYDLLVKPQCPIRNSYAHQLFYKAINYLLLHEYAHITNGHLDYLGRGKKNFLYYENDILSNAYANIEKALEYDADSAATVYSLIDTTGHLLFGDLKLNEHNLNIEIRKSNIAVYFLHKLTELTDFQLEDYIHKTHPFSDQRTSAHTALITTFLEERLSETKLNIDLIGRQGASVITDIAMPGYARIFEKQIIDDRLIFFFSKQGLPYINDVRQAWNSVRDDLEKYSYIKLAPEDKPIDDKNMFDYDEVIKKKRDNNVDSGGKI